MVNIPLGCGKTQRLRLEGLAWGLNGEEVIATRDGEAVRLGERTFFKGDFMGD